MPTYEPIQNSTLGSDTSTVTFSSIPQTYNHLIISIYGRSTRSPQISDRLYIRFNGDVGTVYNTIAAQYDNTQGTNFLQNKNENSQNTLYLLDGFPTAGGAANQYAWGRIDIPSYRNPVWKNMSGILYGERTDGAFLNQGAAMWANTAAITSMTLEVTNQWVAGSQLTLYGVL